MSHVANEGPGGCVPWEQYEALRAANADLQAGLCRNNSCVAHSVAAERANALERAYEALRAERDLAALDADRRSCQGGWRLAQERAVALVRMNGTIGDALNALAEGDGEKAYEALRSIELPWATKDTLA